MNGRRLVLTLNLAGAIVVAGAQDSAAQCCLNDLFAGFHSCFYRAPQAYAVAPIAAPVMVPSQVPVALPPQPVVVPVQQVSYVPETTYRTEYRSVPVTSYKPSCEIDPCTGCPRDCMEQVTNYVQQPVNVPVTQYRAVYSTKYVQMQPQQGYTQPAGYAQPAYGQPAATYPMAAPAAAPTGSAWVPGTTVAPGPAGSVSSPFAAPPVQASPQAWGAAGADISQQVVPGQTSINAPALPQGTAVQPGAVTVPPTYQPQIVPQGGTFTSPIPQTPSLRPTTPPTLAPTPSLKPSTEPANASPTGQAGSGTAGPGVSTPPTSTPEAASSSASPAGSSAANPATGAAAQATTPRLVPIPAIPVAPTAPRGPVNGIPTVPGPGAGSTTGAFPRLVAPTAHTTSWQSTESRAVSYPTAALPSRPQQ
jgi:hypothetical protein